MSTIEVTCNCAWAIKSNDKDAINAATHAHDDVCPLLFKPDKVEHDEKPKGSTE